MVATSVSGKNRSLTRRLMALRLSSEANCPLTRMVMRSGPACTTPEGVTAFCACRDAMIWRASRPSAAILPGRKFKIDHFVLRAEKIDLPTFGHGQDLRARVFHLVAQLAQGQAVGGEGIDIAEHVAKAVVEERPLHALWETGL